MSVQRKDRTYAYARVYGKLSKKKPKMYKEGSLLSMLTGVGAAAKVLDAKAVDRSTEERNGKQDGKKRGAAEAGLDHNPDVQKQE